MADLFAQFQILIGLWTFSFWRNGSVVISSDVFPVDIHPHFTLDLWPSQPAGKQNMEILRWLFAEFTALPLFITTYFSSSQMSVLQNGLWFFSLCIFLLIPRRDMAPPVPTFSRNGNVFHLFDEKWLPLHPLDVCFKGPLCPLFISEVHSLPFRNVHYFLTTQSCLLTFSQLAFFLRQ